MGWIIPKANKKAAGSETKKDPSGDPQESGKTVSRPRLGVKQRLRGKGQGVTETHTVDLRAKSAPASPETRAPFPKDLGEDEEETPQAKPWPSGRSQYSGDSDREDEGVSPEDSRSSQKEAARGSGKRTQKEDQSQRKEDQKRETTERKKEEKTHQGNPVVGDGESRVLATALSSNPAEGQNGVEITQLMAENGTIQASSVGEALKLQKLQEQGMTVSVMGEQRRPLPILRNLQIDQAKEAKKVRGLPGYACSTCALGPECPEFKEGYVCAFNEAFSAFPVRDADSVVSLMAEIVDTNKQRLRMALIQERIASGGMATPDVTRLSEVVMNQARGLVDLQQEVNRVTVSVSGPKESIGSVGGGGIFSRLFGGGSPGSSPVQEVVVEMNPVAAIGEPNRAQDVRAVIDVPPSPAEGAGGSPTGSNEGAV